MPHGAGRYNCRCSEIPIFFLHWSFSERSILSPSLDSQVEIIADTQTIKEHLPFYSQPVFWLQLFFFFNLLGFIKLPPRDTEGS